MLQKTLHLAMVGLLAAPAARGQQPPKPANPYYRCYVGSSAFVLGNLAPNPPAFYQLNVGYRLTPQDVVSLEAITWTYDAPLGIPYGPSYGDEKERYPGSVREYGIGVAYQRFLWRGFYASLQALPLRRVYRDANNQTIGTGFQLFSTFRLGCHVPLFKNRFFIEPSLAATAWPISTNVPPGFASKDRPWNRYFLFEPGLHLGIKF